MAGNWAENCDLAVFRGQKSRDLKNRQIPQMNRKRSKPTEGFGVRFLKLAIFLA